MRGVFKHLWWGVIYDEKLQKSVLSEWRSAAPDRKRFSNPSSTQRS